jgi:hypothetical protein
MIFVTEGYGFSSVFLARFFNAHSRLPSICDLVGVQLRSLERIALVVRLLEILSVTSHNC